MKRKFWVVLGSAILMSAPALASPACLQIGQIFSWNAPNNKTLIVEDIRHTKFKVSLTVSCQDLTFKERVGFKAFGGSELSCLGKGDDVLVRDPGFPQRCPITDIVLYTPEMEKADKAAASAAKAQQNNP